MDLYRPDKYPVIVGKEGSSSALCTVWNDPQDLIRGYPMLKERFAIIGSLYTRAGIPALIRNLALHPEIGYMVIWDYGGRSRTDVGRSGLDILTKLFQLGIADDGLVTGTTYRLETEIDPSCVREIVKSTALSFASDTTNPLVLGNFASPPGFSQPIMRESRAFPMPMAPQVECWPSEIVGWLVRGRTIVDAWLQVVRNVMRYGVEKGTQYGMRQKECIGFSWAITHEDPFNFRPPSDWPAELTELTGSSPKKIAGYLPTILEASDDLEMYGTRLRAYPLSDGTTLDQVMEVLIRNFRESPDSRRAVATTMIPGKDWNSKTPPCLVSVECLQTEGYLHMIATLRSHDIFKGGIPNAIGLRHLQKFIADELGFELGQLLIQSGSAHIYETDWEEANKLVKCAFGIDPEKPVMDPDPRGNFMIRIDGVLIKVTLRSPEGIELMTIENAWPKPIMAKIQQLGLVTYPEHLMYLGYELAAAHACSLMGMEYEQG